MTDIVERLREGGAPGSLMAQAADEIERLRGEKAKLVDEIVHGSVELTRLRAKLAEYENVPVRLRHIMKTGKMPDD